MRERFMPDRQKKEQLEAKIIAHAWKNPSFKEKLLKNPRAAFKEMGLDIPEEVQIKVIEDKPNSYTFVLPPAVAHTEEMSTQELERIAAGAGLLSVGEDCQKHILSQRDC